MIKSIKICHVSDIHKTSDNRIVLKECTSLAEAGYEVHVIAVGESGMNGDVILHGIEPTPRIKRYFGSQKSLLEKAISVGAQVYHLHDPELLRLVRPLKKRTGAKIIYDSHEDYKIQIAIGQPLPIRILMRNWYMHELNAAKKYLDGFILPSFNARVSKEIHPLKMTTVENYPLLTYQVFSLSDKKDNNSVYYIGSISRGRGIIQAVKATARSGAILELAGAINDSNLAKELADMPEWRNVNYHGLVSHDKAMELLSKCSVGLCCFSNQGQYATGANLATKVLEYFLNYVPVLLNNTKYNVDINNQYHFAEIVDDINDIDAYAQKKSNHLSVMLNCVIRWQVMATIMSSTMQTGIVKQENL